MGLRDRSVLQTEGEGADVCEGVCEGGTEDVGVEFSMAMDLSLVTEVLTFAL